MYHIFTLSSVVFLPPLFFFFFFNDTAPPEISPLPLHDALPICDRRFPRRAAEPFRVDAQLLAGQRIDGGRPIGDRKSTRLELQSLAYLVCRLLLEKKKKKNIA